MEHEEKLRPKVPAHMPREPSSPSSLPWKKVEGLGLVKNHFHRSKDSNLNLDHVLPFLGSVLHIYREYSKKENIHGLGRAQVPKSIESMVFGT